MDKNFDFRSIDFDKNQDLIGCIVENRLDDGFKGIMLFVNENNGFFVVPNYEGQILRGYVGEKISVTEFVTTVESGDIYISIRKFEVIDYYDDPFDFDFQFDHEFSQDV
jgi:hypothetical protein